MKRISNNRRNIFIMIILLICFEIICQSGKAQPSEPKTGFMAGQAEKPSISKEQGLLFYLSGEKEFTADFAAGGQVTPNFLREVTVIPDGAHGKGFKAEDSQLMSYWAPGNIFAQRGTLSFFWRSRYPVGPSPFPVFRVGYADHSSWDMVWLRIDYNGSGFDAFVTDIGLSRTRISWHMDKFPDPDEWIHIALSWDETEGIRFYLNGKLVAMQSGNETVYDSGLDQFGPHSRIISPYQVQSAYSFMRGGDIDEIRIYDRMLQDGSIEELAAGNPIKTLPPFKRDLSERRWRDAWWIRNGWNLPNSPPPLLPSSETSVRKVEIHDAYDIKRWYWKANDGIRETTWPGVYNMSRLPGRYDYFVLPDWDCYSGSGQSVKFTIPDEPWNHVEMWGKAWGQLTLESSLRPEYTFGVRSRNQIKSYHHLSETQNGGIIRFDNALIEEPIGSFDVYNVSKGQAPEGTATESFTIVSASGEFEDQGLKEIVAFIRGRYPADERAMMLGMPVGSRKIAGTEPASGYSYPFIHILIPYSRQSDTGLDGLKIQLPPMNVKPTHNGIFPVNIRVKDPLWQMRDLADFSFSVKPGDSPRLWIDIRDRILPKERALYLTIAGAGADLTPYLLQGTRIKLVYKTREAARAEHELDRFTQVRDLYSHIVEENPRNQRLNLYNRIMADCNDLLSVNPDHWPGQTYRYALSRDKMPVYEIAKCPDDIPEWAFLQIEYIRHMERVVSYYIDNRQISNGEFGGGLSDDGDLTNMWPAMAFMGVEPEKIFKSLSLHMAAYFNQNRSSYEASLRQRSLPLFTNGLATIITDELHSLEEGLQVVAQCMLLDYGTPLHIERGMETALRMCNDITQINPAGHRHIRSRYYGGTRIATEDPWQWTVTRSYPILQTSYLVGRYNGNPKVRQMIIEIADGLLAHRRDGRIVTEINFATDESRGGAGGGESPLPLFIAAYNFTGDKKYLELIPSGNSNVREFNKEKLVQSYSEEIRNLGIRKYINTEGSLWTDRVTTFNTGIQEDRLGGVALRRLTDIYPRHLVSWSFNTPATWESAAIFLSRASPTSINIIAYNLDQKPVNADMTVWEINPGKWRIRQGIDTNDDQVIDSDVTESVADLKRGELLNLVFAPRKYNLVSLELIEPAEKGYGELPDPGIGPTDISITGDKVTVRVHNVGAVASPVTTMELRDADGKLISTATVPSLEAPLDLKPRWTDIKITVPEGADICSGSVRIDPEKKITQITGRNDLVKW